jgi:hypothetical protein
LLSLTIDIVISVQVFFCVLGIYSLEGPSVLCYDTFSWRQSFLHHIKIVQYLTSTFTHSLCFCLQRLSKSQWLVYICGLAISNNVTSLNLNYLGANLCFYGLIVSVAAQFVLPYTNKRKVWWSTNNLFHGLLVVSAFSSIFN